MPSGKVDDTGVGGRANTYAQKWREQRKIKPRGKPSRAANVWTARIIPLFLLGIIGYSSWVVTKIICIDYLINPGPSLVLRKQIGAAIAILVIFYLLLIPVLICWTRLILTITFNPGFVPRGPQWSNEQTQNRSTRPSRRKSHRLTSTTEKENSRTEPGHQYSSGGRSVTKDEPRTEQFWQYDAFLVNYDGRPPFCSTCFNWKLDRVHHCSEVDRCVRKMDHFCPWVGGVVGETSFKFFLQLLFYTMLLTLHLVVFISYYLSQRRSQDSDFLNVHWILAIAFAAMFLLFSAGMLASSVRASAINSTTIEGLSKSRVFYVAVYLPRPEETKARIEAAGGKALRLITYPRPMEEQHIILQQAGATPSSQPMAASTSQAGVPTDASSSRTFAILDTPPGMNIWDCGPMRNLQDVLGFTLLEWLLPLKHSPCADHTNRASIFKLGPEFRKVKESYGLQDREDTDAPSSHRNKKRRRRRRSQREEVPVQENLTQTSSANETQEG